MTDELNAALPSSRQGLPQVSPVDQQLGELLRKRLDAKTKPPGSLGRLEDLAVQVAMAQGTGSPSVERPVIIVFAADHGIVEEGVSAWPQSVTTEMVKNMLAGGAAINVIAAALDIDVRVVDSGMAADLGDQDGLIHRKMGSGTGNFAHQAAMSEAQCRQALAIGASLAMEQSRHGSTVLGLGEMGIGNTSSAALLMAMLLEIPIAHCVGAGAGLDDAGIAHKQELLEVTGRRLTRNLRGVRANSAYGARQVLAECGGFEIAMMAGAMVGGAACRMPVLVDGFIAGAAALVARALVPQVHDYLIWTHCSAERGHRRLLEGVGATALLDLQMRLGEGSGGALAVPLLRAAVAVLNDMASFEQAGVSGPQ